MADQEGTISALLKEDRRFPPSEAFTSQAHWSDPAIYEQAREAPEEFWAQMAEAIDWFEPWNRFWSGIHRRPNGFSVPS